MTKTEIQYLKDTVGLGSANNNNPTWIKAFNESYPTLRMDVDANYMKVLCLLTTPKDNG